MTTCCRAGTTAAAGVGAQFAREDRPKMAKMGQNNKNAPQIWPKKAQKIEMQPKNGQNGPNELKCSPEMAKWTKNNWARKIKMLPRIGQNGLKQ